MKRKWLWVRMNTQLVRIYASIKEPKAGKNGDWPNPIEAICSKWFKRVFGFLPPKFETVKIEFSARIVNEETHK